MEKNISQREFDNYRDEVKEKFDRVNDDLEKKVDKADYNVVKGLFIGTLLALIVYFTQKLLNGGL